ncbi:type I restriction endonuclease subunit R [Pseudokineococcus sp. 1T1Z-3]|uniref:type I restriction endonuclease subunit R n=1 Tax=Pseudokineococcus sp. 1T1Z-3 TaxID=3132745 RepID=UPI00309E23E8
MPGQHTEKSFEDELCAHLAAHGWWYSETSQGYDKERALFPEDVFGWLQDTQPAQVAKVMTAGSSSESQQRAQLLDRLVKVLATPVEAGGGTLNALRRGFKHVSATFDLCEWKPETSLNPTTTERYGKVRVRVVRQVHFSTADTRSVDLVLFVNGLPVATLELKTDFTQSVTEAIQQYRKKRQPKDPKTGHAQPLLTPGRGALVHFAVSNSEVWMTTQLRGDKTHFLPFNTGYAGGAGNPPATAGASATAYLWKQVLQRDALLTILGKFLHHETTTRYDPITGAPEKRTTLLFPRYHQWDVVTCLAEAARAEGPGHRYLVQHSAGSGKTNSIAWTAHRLARLHDDQDQKVFDSVIVVTDRTVLDSQLQEAIRQIDGAGDVAMTIDVDSVAKSSATSKSGLLAQSLLAGRLIIVVTLQTFPYAMAAIAETKGLADKRFAVIADEAHSSQTGQTANQLKAVLTTEEAAELADGGEVDVEALLAAQAGARASGDTVSYVAFTATPKGKTLELFGRPPVDDPTGTPVPYHVYTMKQAIEEQYILDVLPGYQTYATAFRVAQQATDGTLTTVDADELVDEAAATKGLMRWVRLHPTNIAQKVAIIVEHFRENVAGLLDGHAKAMVVTDSRKAAVRYKLAIDAYIAKRGYDMRALVAFSGTVEDLESGPDAFSEASMNPGASADLRRAFQRDEYRVMLVANKFQTGFDQPLLCAMYVDRRLSGVTAVQTLSRLNRVYRTPSGTVKGTPMVLDFVNEPEEIRLSFEPYYTDAHLETRTDPNLVHDIASKLDEAAIYTEDDLEAVARAVLEGKGNNVLTSAVSPAKQRYVSRRTSAMTANGGQGDREALDALEVFRKDLGTFVRVYDFLSQVVDYSDAGLEKRALLCRCLAPLLRDDSWSAEVDLGDVALVHVKQVATGTHDLGLGERTGLSGLTAAGSAAAQDPKLVALAEIIERLNTLFGDEDFTDGQKQSFVEGSMTVLLENETLRTQAEANSVTQFAESPDLKDEFLGTIADNQGVHTKLVDFFFSDSPQVEVLIGAFAKAFHAAVEEQSAQAS